ncbi:BLUF domain-containing protein [Maritalea sp.]|uniref:BLUF domain-containing protein n=1 Tax=Maritalea sp. TaxID=2003361 RepID=UPI003EF39C37
MLTTDNMLQSFQIIYASLAVKELDQDNMRDLLQIARKNNSSVNVGGMLVYHDDCFLQVLEGPRIAVEAIFKRVSTDPRHTNVNLLLKCEIVDAEFSDRSMACINADGENKSIEGYVNYLEQLEEQVQVDTRALRVLRRFKNGNWRHVVLDEELILSA